MKLQRGSHLKRRIAIREDGVRATLAEDLA
jgi:hypothetical protein